MENLSSTKPTMATSFTTFARDAPPARFPPYAASASGVTSAGISGGIYFSTRPCR
jgi:hypothetical protein